MHDRPETDADRMIAARYGDSWGADKSLSVPLERMLSRGSCRRFLDRPVPGGLLRLLCAAALAAPTKSDLQQRDIILLEDIDQRDALAKLVSGQDWVKHAPMIVVFCGNNRRQRLVHDWTGVPFANDHMDALFNAIADAAIALGAFVSAAEAMGLGCCPISAVRNEARAVSNLLDLPDHVFPLAGLGLGYPAQDARISMRLPLNVTCHSNRYKEANLRDAISSYDRTRAAVQPPSTQRLTEVYGVSEDYGWCADKARQYAVPEREDCGAFLRDKGFRFD